MAPLAGFDQAAGIGGFEDVTGHSLNDTGDKLDVTNTGHNGKQHLIPGIQRARGNITRIVDGDNIPNYSFGQKVVANFSYGEIRLLDSMITSVNWASAVNGTVTVNCDVEQDGDLE